MATPTMDLVKPLITLLAIVNPLAIVPFFIHYTQGYTEAQRKRTAWVSAFSAFVVIAVSALLGLQLLSFFGISIASFQVGGGMLLLISSLNMLNAQPAESKTSKDEIRADGGEGLAGRLDRGGAADHSAADRAGHHVDRGHLRRARRSTSGSSRCWSATAW